MRPRLLISVRNVAEASAAIAGGCDLLDVKEPANGSLGMAAVSDIRDVVRVAAEADMPVSAALGETRDWLHRDDVPALPAGLSFAKLGTAGLKTVPNWTDRWQTIRQRFKQEPRPSESESRLGWVAVAYADWEQIDAPSPAEVLELASNQNCDGFLIDTFLKQGRTLFDCMATDAVAGLVRSVQKEGMFCALAGSLSFRELPIARELDPRPDIIAVRSAACRDGKRNAAVDTAAVRRLRDLLSGSRAATVRKRDRAFGAQ